MPFAAKAKARGTLKISAPTIIVAKHQYFT